jgi:hypothetical protein
VEEEWSMEVENMKPAAAMGNADAFLEAKKNNMGGTDDCYACYCIGDCNCIEKSIGTNIGGIDGTDIGGNLAINVEGNKGTNVEGNLDANVGGMDCTNIGLIDGINIGGSTSPCACGGGAAILADENGNYKTCTCNGECRCIYGSKKNDKGGSDDYKNCYCIGECDCILRNIGTKVGGSDDKNVGGITCPNVEGSLGIPTKEGKTTNFGGGTGLDVEGSSQNI